MSGHMNGAKILIVEDEQTIAMDVRAQVSDPGYDVVGIASTGKEALRRHTSIWQ